MGMVQGYGGHSPARIYIEKMMEGRTVLYKIFHPPVQTIPVVLIPFTVDGLVSEEDEVAWAV